MAELLDGLMMELILQIEVMSYEPNNFGIYDMAGNVAEWVADVYRPIVDDEFSDFGYYRGNVYTKNAIGEDGGVTVIGIDDIEYDTLSNGKVIATGLPGQISQVPVDENETYLRTNFDESNNINYRMVMQDLQDSLMILKKMILIMML